MEGTSASSATSDEKPGDFKDPADQLSFYGLFIGFIAILTASAFAYGLLHYNDKVSPEERIALASIQKEIEKIQGVLKASGETNSSSNSSISSSIEVIRREIDKAPPSQIPDLAKQLENLEKNGQEKSIEESNKTLDELTKATLYTRNPYFWDTGYQRLLEYFFWGLFGTLIYLLNDLVDFRKKDDRESFYVILPWYIFTLIRGPFTVLVVMMGLNAIQFGVTGLEVGLNLAPIEIIIVLSASLGFYHRIAKDQLGTLVKGFFPDAWAKADMDNEGKTQDEVESKAEEIEIEIIALENTQNQDRLCLLLGEKASIKVTREGGRVMLNNVPRK